MTNNLVGHKRVSSSVGSLCISYYRIQPLKEYGTVTSHSGTVLPKHTRLRVWRVT